MAKMYSSLAGRMSGRVGSTVFRSGQNTTIAAQYNPSVSNPKTAAQAVQRAAFATATTAQSALLEVVDHSHEKLSTRRENLQRFVQQNAAMVRAGIITDYQGGFTNVLPCIKGARNISPAPYVISEGSLLFPRTEIVELGGERYAAIRTSSTPAETITTQEQYEEALAAIGLLPGDQLSLIVIVQDTETQIASVEYNGIAFPQFACEVLKARVTLVSTLPSGFSGSLFSNSVFNNALVEKKEGVMICGIEQVESDQRFIASLPAVGDNYEMAAAVLIRSQAGDNGYKYSNSRMAVALEAESDIAWPRATSYMEGANVVIGDQPFLDNPLRGIASVSSSESESSVAVIAGLPLAVGAGETITIRVPLPASPSECKIILAQGGNTAQSIDIVGLDDGTSITTSGMDAVKTSGVGAYSSDHYEFALSVPNDSTATAVLSGYAIANGTRYTF